MITLNPNNFPKAFDKEKASSRASEVLQNRIENAISSINSHLGAAVNNGELDFKIRFVEKETEAERFITEQIINHFESVGYKVKLIPKENGYWHHISWSN